MQVSDEDPESSDRESWIPTNPATVDEGEIQFEVGPPPQTWRLLLSK